MSDENKKWKLTPTGELKEDVGQEGLTLNIGSHRILFFDGDETSYLRAEDLLNEMLEKLRGPDGLMPDFKSEDLGAELYAYYESGKWRKPTGGDDNG